MVNIMNSIMEFFYGGEVMAKAKIISVINYKGGVGKTVSSYNIGAGLNFLNHHSVLLIDLDPQCSLSRICLRAYSHTVKKPVGLSSLKEEETINHVFKTYLHQDILDFDVKINLEKLIKKDFYTGGNYRLGHFDFIPCSMYTVDSSSYIRGLDDLEGDIKRKYSQGLNTTLQQVSLLAKFLRDYKLDEQYDFIIFDCPPANNMITQNALIVSDYYLIPILMDDMGVQGVHHVKNIVEKTFIKEIIEEYATIIQLSPMTSYLKYFKGGIPKLLGVFETMKKTGSNTEQPRLTIKRSKESIFLFDSIIYHQIEMSHLIDEGDCCFIKSKSRVKTPLNEAYGRLIFEILERLSVGKKSNARKVTDVL